LLTFQSDLVAHVRILDTGAELWLEDAEVRESVVVAELIEPLKGVSGEKELRFVQHGHGVPNYLKDEEVVVFLQRIERSRELGTGPVAEHVHWVSAQEEGSKFLLDSDTRADLTAAVRAYAALEKHPPTLRLDALRRITLKLLASRQPALATSALRDVVLTAREPIIGTQDLPQLEPLIASANTPIGVRIGLLAELERRGLVDGPPRWAELLRTTRGGDQLAVVRAAGAHPSDPVAKELAAMLDREDPLLVVAVAVSLGTPGNEAAVAPLAKLLASNQPRVRMAAIRGLGKIATPAARQAVAQVAGSHPDPRTQNRARAEVKLIDRTAASRRVAPGPNPELPGGEVVGDLP
jgi:hypothetical protein